MLLGLFAASGSAQGLSMLNVRDFGAAGDSVTDDTAAIQAAIDQAASVGGDRVCVPIGKYMASQLRIKRGVMLYGDGWNSIVAALPGSTQHLIVLDTPDVIWTEIRDLTLNGNKANITTPIDAVNYDGQTVTGAKNHRLTNLQINQWTGNGITFGTNLGTSFLERLWVGGNNGNGILLGCPDQQLNSIAVGLSGLAGLVLNGGSNLLVCVKSFWSGQIDPSQGDAFQIVGNNNHLVGCQSQDSARHGFFLAGCQKAYISGSMCDSNHADDYHLDGADYCRIEGHVGDSGRGDQTAILAMVNSPTNNLIRLTYHPNALVAGNPSVSGSTAGNDVQVGLAPFGSSNYDPPNLAKGAQTTTNITVSGAVLGDLLAVGFSNDLQGVQLTAYVSAANTVTCIFQNGTGSSVNLSAGTLSARVVK